MTFDSRFEGWRRPAMQINTRLQGLRLHALPHRHGQDHSLEQTGGCSCSGPGSPWADWLGPSPVSVRAVLWCLCCVELGRGCSTGHMRDCCNGQLHCMKCAACTICNARQPPHWPLHGQSWQGCAHTKPALQRQGGPLGRPCPAFQLLPVVHLMPNGDQLMPSFSFVPRSSQAQGPCHRSWPTESACQRHYLVIVLGW